jgi:hypothetical protein
MQWYYVGPAAVFLVALLSSLRVRALGAAAAGLGTGIAAATTLGFYAMFPGESVLVFLVLLVVSAAMAFAEGVAASILARGGLLGALALAFAAHGLILFLLLRHALSSSGGHNLVLYWLIPPAMFGGSAAALGASLSGKRRS